LQPCQIQAVSNSTGKIELRARVERSPTDAQRSLCNAKKERTMGGQE
jgi:hypothetical protein